MHVKNVIKISRTEQIRPGLVEHSHLPTITNRLLRRTEMREINRHRTRC